MFMKKQPIRHIAILGATSALAQAAAKLFAQDAASFFLVGRSESHLQAVKDDLNVRGAFAAEYAVCDLASASNHELLFEELKKRFPEMDAVLIAYGSLGNHALTQRHWEAAQEEIQTNFVSVVSLLTLLAAHFEEKGRGLIAVIGSVSGDRGRQSNYVYGAAKGGLEIFLQGLRNRLYKKGVRVLTIKPGMVATPMTAHMKQGLLFSTPEKVGRDIYKAMNQNKDVLYTPCYWRLIMCILKSIPEFLFKRLSF
jgi:short-subunit dehydrogenase